MHVLILEVSLGSAINQQIFKGGGISDKTAPVFHGDQFSRQTIING